MGIHTDLSGIKWDESGLIPAVVQNADGGEVSMLGYMNAAALRKTLDTGYVTFFSRSRQALWTKGETSGNRLRVVSIDADCDRDALLVVAHVEGDGYVCHENVPSCFHNPIFSTDEGAGDAGTTASSAMLDELYAVIEDRKRNPKEGSYTNYLFEKGVPKIAKKVGEEAVELVIEAVRGDNKALVGEAADLIYHMLVLLSERGVAPEAVYGELANRR